MVIDTGAYPGIGGMLFSMIEGLLPGPYKIGALEFQFTAVVTNKASYVAYRGPWAAETFVRERIIDLVARELGIEPLEIRLRNVVTRDEPPLTMITGRSLVGITVRESLERMAELVDLPGFPAPSGRRPEREGRYLGIGIASYIEAAPGPRAVAASRSAPSDADASRGGRHACCVFTRQMPHGQSHETTLAQIAADQFGVAFEYVRVVVGDSDASRSASLPAAAGLPPWPAAPLSTPLGLAAPRCSRSPPISSRPPPRTCGVGRRG